MRTRLAIAIVAVAVAAALGAWAMLALGHRLEAGDRPQVEETDRPPLSREEEAGRLLFEPYCGPCHGRTGDGFGINAPNLATEVPSLAPSTRVGAWSDARLLARIARGGGTSKQPPVCPAWGPRLTPRDIDSLVAFIRLLSSGRLDGRAAAAATVRGSR